jgi:hypothetical protein
MEGRDGITQIRALCSFKFLMGGGLVEFAALSLGRADATPPIQLYLDNAACMATAHIMTTLIRQGERMLRMWLQRNRAASPYFKYPASRNQLMASVIASA